MGKLLKLLISFVVVFSFIGTQYFSTTASAASVDGISTEDVEMAQDLVSYLKFDQKSQKVVITDKKGLADYIKNNDIGISMKEAKNQIKQLNNTFSGKNGVDRQKELDSSLQTVADEALDNSIEQSKIGPQSLSCSDAMTIIGFFHTGSYTTLGAAATAAGFAVNPWALAALTIMVGGAYAAGSIFGCD